MRSYRADLRAGEGWLVSMKMPHLFGDLLITEDVWQGLAAPVRVTGAIGGGCVA
jgi:hypothetical protein